MRFNSTADIATIYSTRLTLDSISAKCDDMSRVSCYIDFIIISFHDDLI